MLSTAADLAQLAQMAPWLAVSLLSLLASLWVYRQSGKRLQAAEDRLQGSANRQGERLGELEHTTGLLDLRRRITEEELLEDGIRLSHWPPDGPRPQPAPRRYDDDQADEEPRTNFVPSSPPVPPLPSDIGARHRRNATA